MPWKYDRKTCRYTKQSGWIEQALNWLIIRYDASSYSLNLTDGKTENYYGTFTRLKNAKKVAKLIDDG